MKASDTQGGIRCVYNFDAVDCHIIDVKPEQYGTKYNLKIKISKRGLGSEEHGYSDPWLLDKNI